MQIGRCPDPDDIKVGERHEIRPVAHRRRLRDMFGAEFLRAFVGGIRDRDDLDIIHFFQGRQVPCPNDIARADDPDPKFVIASLHGYLISAAATHPPSPPIRLGTSAERWKYLLCRRHSPSLAANSARDKCSPVDITTL